jgi:hypothetical protein
MDEHPLRTSDRVTNSLQQVRAMWDQWDSILLVKGYFLIFHRKTPAILSFVCLRSECNLIPIIVMAVPILSPARIPILGVIFLAALSTRGDFTIIKRPTNQSV